VSLTCSDIASLATAESSRYTFAPGRLLGYRCAAVIVIGSGLADAELRELTDRITVPMVEESGAAAPVRSIHYAHAWRKYLTQR
jgi:hypothetical protein